MANFTDLGTWQETAVAYANDLASAAAGALPRLAAAVALLGLGWMVARTAEMVTVRALRRLGLDRAAERLRVTEALREGGVDRRASETVGRLIFWLLILTFVLSAIQTLGIAAAASMVERLLDYVPRLAAAGLVVGIGALGARLVRGVVASAAIAANLAHASRLGAAAQAGVLLIVAVLALEQLGVETALLVAMVTGLAIALTLTLGISFALGARGVVSHILAGHYLRQSLPSGRVAEVQGRRGVVEGVGPIATVFRGESETWSIPNGRLLEEVVSH